MEASYSLTPWMSTSPCEPIAGSHGSMMAQLEITSRRYSGLSFTSHFVKMTSRMTSTIRVTCLWCRSSMVRVSPKYHWVIRLVLWIWLKTVSLISYYKIAISDYWLDSRRKGFQRGIGRRWKLTIRAIFLPAPGQGEVSPLRWQQEIPRHHKATLQSCVAQPKAWHIRKTALPGVTFFVIQRHPANSIR